MIFEAFMIGRFSKAFSKKSFPRTEKPLGGKGLMDRYLAEGVGFEPTIGFYPDKRLAGARTKPLCDPSNWHTIL